MDNCVSIYTESKKCIKTLVLTQVFNNVVKELSPRVNNGFLPNLWQLYLWPTSGFKSGKYSRFYRARNAFLATLVSDAMHMVLRFHYAR